MSDFLKVIPQRTTELECPFCHTKLSEILRWAGEYYFCDCHPKDKNGRDGNRLFGWRNDRGKWSHLESQCNWKEAPFIHPEIKRGFQFR
jgi:uncharacterized Zn-finger protein